MKPKLSLDDLVVTTFDTTSEPVADLIPVGGSGPVACFDPTPDTRCFYCPPATFDGCI